jgi:hypothetical protein
LKSFSPYGGKSLKGFFLRMGGTPKLFIFIPLRDDVQGTIKLRDDDQVVAMLP